MHISCLSSVDSATHLAGHMLAFGSRKSHVVGVRPFSATFTAENQIFFTENQIFFTEK